MCKKMSNFASEKGIPCIMTPAEYIQLKAFARVDGALLALLWTVSFACYVAGIAQPLYAIAALLLMVATPFFVGKRLRRFRDESLGGFISMLRGWAFVILVFFYGGILLALVQYVYFAYIDQGYLLASFTTAIQAPENKQVIEAYGMQQAVDESLTMMSTMRPIDYALNVLTMNITIGIIIGLPIAALLQKKCVKKV